MEKLSLLPAQWIWHNAPEGDDEYADFLADFTLAAAEELTLRIAADSNYSVWLDGVLIACGQYADYPNRKFADEIALSAEAGAHRLAVQVWYYGIDTQTYRRGKAGVIFTLKAGEKLLAASGADTPARLSPEYIHHRGEMISGQLGPTWYYDANGEDGWRMPGSAAAFGPARVVEGVMEEFRPRPIFRLMPGERTPSEMIQQGTFSYNGNTARSSERMQRAALAFCPLRQMAGTDKPVPGMTLKAESGEGIYMIFDLKREEAGFAELDFEVPSACDVEIGYGEHLSEGRCRTEVRNFSADFKAKAGRNTYLNTFRRFGCRYLQVFVHSPELTLHYIGLRPTNYPLNVLPYKADNLLRQRVYDTCLRTLLLCMHEHYEDCPWREQALYTMDSRNQMLCGYYAFGEYRFPRACLDLMSGGVSQHGLLNLCFPAGRDYPIAFFTLMYFIQMREYADYSGDDSLLREHYGLLEQLLSVFLNRMAENGLCPNFTDKAIWNFYEWQPTMEGYTNRDKTGSTVSSFDAPLNAFLSLALGAMTAISEKIGKSAEAEKYAALRMQVNAAIRRLFFREDKKLFRSFDCIYAGSWSVLTNSLCLLCGAADGLDTTEIEALLVKNGTQYSEEKGIPMDDYSMQNLDFSEENPVIIPSTLSMNCFRFDALLNLNREKYAPVILDEIDETYMNMLQQGATTFWETVLGERDFSKAGSLCHGWSALPVYYYHILCK